MLNKDSVFVIGLDGGTFNLLHPLMDADIMPNLQHLVKTGSSGLLRSAIPPVTGPAWASFQTGTNPGKHGVVDFLRYQPGSYEPALINSKAIQGQTLWKILSEHERRICVINVPLTYPPQSVRGYLISGFLTPSIDVSFTHPPELRRRLLNYIPDYPIVPMVPMEIATSGLDQFVKRLLHTIWQRRKATAWLIEQGSWDFFMVHFQATDVLQHALWDCADFAHPNRAKYLPSEQALVRQFYHELDQIIGDLVQLAGDASIIVMSDHGFGPARKRVYLNQWLVNHGYMALTASKSWMRIQAGFEGLVKKLDVFDLRRRWLPKDFKRERGRLIRRLTQTPWIDWARTRASVFSGSTFGNLYVNRVGRDSLGMVTESEYERLRAELIECFQALIDPDTDQPVVDQVYRREEVYTGPMVAELPDLIIRPCGGYLLETRFKGDRLFDPMPQGLTGMHRMDGIYILSGGHFTAQSQQRTADIVDLAATILYSLGIPVPEWMDGRVLAETVCPTGQLLNERVILDKQPAADHDAHTQSYSAEDEAQVMERLHGLGYL